MRIGQPVERKPLAARDQIGCGIIVAPFGDEGRSPERLRHPLADRAQREGRAHGDELANMPGAHRCLPLREQLPGDHAAERMADDDRRSEEETSELTSLSRNSYAVF